MGASSSACASTATIVRVESCADTFPAMASANAPNANVDMFWGVLRIRGANLVRAVMGDLQRERAAVGRLPSGDSWDEASDRDSTATYNKIAHTAIRRVAYRHEVTRRRMPPG